MKDQMSAAHDQATELFPLAEHMFGPVTSSWEYEGVIFRDHAPHLYYFPETGLVQISLSFRAIDDDLQRDFQLAHEICHLLYPSVDLEEPIELETNVINEGISTYFSVLVVTAYHGEEAAQLILNSLIEFSSNYYAAFKQVSNLIKQDSNAIKKLREIQPMINEICTEDFIASGLELTEEQIELLIAKF